MSAARQSAEARSAVAAPAAPVPPVPPAPTAVREDPRVTRTRSVVLAAAADLLAERGYAGFTMDALVERTGVSKTTMYKHWPSRTALVAATVRQPPAANSVPDTGSVRDDLIAMALDNLNAYRGPRWPGLASVLEAAGHDPELQAALESVPPPDFAQLRTVLERAVERGQLRAGISIETAITVLIGTIFFRLRLADLAQVKREVPGIIDTILEGLAPPGPRRRDAAGLPSA